jgi:fatty acid desaturase
MPRVGGATGMVIAHSKVRRVRETQNFDTDAQKEKAKMLWTILVVLLVLWLIGAIGGIGGSLIHLLLVVALIVLVINLLTGRRTV